MSPILIEDNERGIQRAMLEWLNTIPGVRVWRQNTGAVASGDGPKRRYIRFGVAGQADLSGIGPGGVRIEIEVKSPTGKMTEKQAFWLDDIHKSGGIAFYANSIDMCVRRMREEFEARGWKWEKRWQV